MAGKNPSTVEYRSTALDQNIPVTPATPMPVTDSTLSSAISAPGVAPAAAVGVQGLPGTNSTVAAYATSKVVKASAGRLLKVNGYNSKTSAQFIQLHDAAALPADAAVPVAILYVGPQQNFSFDYGLDGRSFANGIVVCNSSTGPTKTIGSADCWFDAQYN